MMTYHKNLITIVSVIIAIQVIDSNGGVYDPDLVNKREQELIESWSLSGPNTDTASRVVNGYVTKRTDSEDVRHTYKISGKNTGTDLWHDQLRKIIVDRDSAGKIKSLHLKVSADRYSLDTFTENKLLRDNIRRSVALMLLCFGELDWVNQDDPLVYAAVPDCKLTVSIDGEASSRSVELGRLMDQNTIRTEVIGSNSAVARVSEDSSMSVHAWIFGKTGSPDGVVLTFGVSMHRFGTEDRALDPMYVVLRQKHADMRSHGAFSKFVKFTERMRNEWSYPSNYSDTLLKDEKFNVVEEWNWNIEAELPDKTRYKIGILKRDKLIPNALELRSWRKATFTLDLEIGFPQSPIFPTRITCRRNDNGQLSMIALSYAELAVADAKIEELPDIARSIIGMLLSIGALDTLTPIRTCEDRVLPVGIQIIEFSENASVQHYLASNKELVLDHRIDEIIPAHNSELELMWTREYASIEGLNHKFAGLSAGTADESGINIGMQFVRGFYRKGSGDPFFAPSVAIFKCSNGSGKDNRTEGQSIWLLRQKPPSQYFAQWLDVQRAAAKIILESTLESNEEPFVNKRIDTLKTWLDSEELDAVMNALHRIESAKRQWGLAENAAASQEVTWNDIAPYMLGSVEDLPRPGSGNYILGDTLGDVPDYVK